MKSHRIRDAARDAVRDVADRAGEQVQPVELRERLAPVVDHAIQVAREQATQAAAAAGHARHWAAPRVEAAVEWAAPRVERGLQAAAPRVEAAADRVAPAVDAARDRIIEDLLPWLIEAVHAAGAAGSAAAAAAGATATDSFSTAADSVSRGIEGAARSLADATPSAKADRRRRRTRFVLIAAAFAALAAGAAAFKRSRSHDNGWEAAPTGVAVESADRPLGEVTGVPVVSPERVTEAVGEQPVTLGVPTSIDPDDLAVDQETVAPAPRPAAVTAEAPSAQRQQSGAPEVSVPADSSEPGGQPDGS